MFKSILHWFFHSWSNWTEPYDVEYHEGGVCSKQKRICKVCGMIEERML